MQRDAEEVSSYLHNLILKFRQEPIDDLVFLDGQRVQVDFLHALDLASFDEASQFRDGLPFFLLALLSAAAGSSTSAPSSSVAASIAPRAKSTTSCSTSVGHSRLCVEIGSEWCASRLVCRRAFDVELLIVDMGSTISEGYGDAWRQVSCKILCFPWFNFQYCLV